MARTRDKFSGRDWLAVLGIAGGFGLALWGRQAVAKPSSSTPSSGGGTDGSTGPSPFPWPGRRPVPPRDVPDRPQRLPLVYCAKGRLSPADIDDLGARLGAYLMDAPTTVPYEESIALTFSMTREFMQQLCPGYPFPANEGAVEGFRAARPAGWGAVYDYVYGSIFRRFNPGYT